MIRNTLLTSYTRRFILAFGVLTILFGSISSVSAQQDGVSAATLGMVGASHFSAVNDLQGQLIDTLVHRQGHLAPQGGYVIQELDRGSGSPTEFPTARLRATRHDGYKSLLPNHQDTFASHAREGSAIGSVFFNAPELVDEGNLVIGVFAGFTHLDVEYKQTPQSDPILPGTDAINNSLLGGGYALYTLNNRYIMATLAGEIGATRQSGGIDAGSPTGGSSYDVYGVVTSVVAGNVIDIKKLSGSHDGLNLDLRTGLSYLNFSTETFVDPFAQTISADLNGLTGSLSATLFYQINVDNHASMRPYIKGELRQQLTYRNVEHTSFGGVPDKYEYDQADTTGVGEIGFDYARPDLTVNVGLYGETSSDRSTIGGKIGAKFKLN